MTAFMIERLGPLLAALRHRESGQKRRQWPNNRRTISADFLRTCKTKARIARAFALAEAAFQTQT
jgi:hypothetical protein